MKNGLPYYKAYPRDFIEGTIGMPFEVKCAYRVILDMIYMQRGELPDDARYISGLLGCSVRKWKGIRTSLIDAGKIHVSGEFLTNYRAIKELEILTKLQDNQREKALKPRKNKGLEKPRQRQRAIYTEPEPDKSSVTNVTDADASKADPVKVMFDTGISILAKADIPDKQARAMIGRWRKEFGDDAVMLALARCNRENASDPLPFIQGCLRFEKRRPPQHGAVKVKNGQRYVYRATDGWVREYV